MGVKVFVVWEFDVIVVGIREFVGFVWFIVGFGCKCYKFVNYFFWLFVVFFLSIKFIVKRIVCMCNGGFSWN